MCACIHMYVSVYTCNSSKKQIPKYNSRKHVWNPCEQKYKILMKKIKEDINKKDTQYTWIEAEGIVLPNYKPYYNNIT